MLSLFRKELSKFNIPGARMSDSVYNLTVNLL